MYYVYALRKPDGPIFYIGRTSSPKLRLTQHLCDTKHVEKYAVICELKEQGHRPLMDILFETEDEYQSCVEEMRQIALHEGLTNRNPGNGVFADDRIALGLYEPPVRCSAPLPLTHSCKRCNYEWRCRSDKTPAACPKCKSYQYDKPRKEKKSGS